MEDLKIIIIGISALIFGVFTIRKYYKKLKKIETSDMLFATGFNILLSGILGLGLGLAIVIFELMKFLK